MESPSISEEVVHLYDRLRGCIYANDQGGVDETCRELLRAGRSLSEILQYKTLISNEIKRSPAESPRSSLYYWGQLWTVRPRLNSGLPRLSPPPARIEGLGPTTDVATEATRGVSGPEPPPAARHELVKEWQARQHLADSTPETARPASAVRHRRRALLGDPAPPAEPPQSLSEDVKSEGSRRQRSSAIFLPIAGLYGGAVAIVCVGVFLLLQLGGTRLASNTEPSLAGAAQNASVADPSGAQPGENQPPPSAPERQTSPSGLSGLEQPTRASDEMRSPVPEPTPTPDKASITAAEPKGEPAPPEPPAAAAPEPPDQNQPAGPSDASRTPADTPPAIGVDTAATSEAVSRTKPAGAQTSVTATEIVIKGAAASGLPPGDRSARGAGVVSPEATTARPTTVPLSPTNPSAVMAPPEAEHQPTTNLATADPNSTEGTVRNVTAAPVPGLGSAAATNDKNKPTLDGPGSRTDATALLSRGDAVFGTGDIASARLFYERAADAGNAQAAIRLGETFDPAFLARAQMKGVRGDPAVALRWYKRARELGASEADVLVMSLDRK